MMRISRCLFLALSITVCLFSGTEKVVADAPHISYDLRLPHGALLAMARFWAARPHTSQVKVDAAFIPARIAKAAHVERVTVQGTPDASGFPRDYYYPNYYYQVSKDEIYLWWSAVLPQNSDYSGGSVIQRVGGHWKVRVPRTTKVPISLQAAVCKLYIKQPPSPHKLHVLVDSYKQIEHLVDATYLTFEPFAKSYQWTNEAQLGLQFGETTWIDTSDALVGFETLTKPVERGEVYDYGHTLLLRKTRGRWKAYDVGLVSSGD